MIHFCFTHRGNHNQKKFMIIMLHILKGKKNSFLFAELSSTWWENKTTRQELPLILATDLPAEAILASPFLTATCEVISSHCQFQGIGFFLQPYRQPCYRPLLSPACAYTALPCFCIFLPHRLILLVLVTSGLLRQVTTLSVRTSSLWNSLHWHSSGTLISTPTFLQHWSC